ncbi:MAG: tyrosine-type recombinase/integrase [Prolixibacteraceae bacterium]|nr:tyrosine-type recombinase/integrase [Prolixibacteraceae bacterium]
MNNQSTLKAYKSGLYEYIYIYFKLNGNVIRINTKNKVVKNGMTNDLLYNTKVEEYKKKNEKTLELKKLVDNYIRIQLEDFHPIVDQKKLEAILKSRGLTYKLSLADKIQLKPEDFEGKIVLKPKYLNEFYQDFFNLKQKDLNEREGIKHYKSLQNALLDYQTHINKTLTLSDVNSYEFILDFRNFLTLKHPDTDEYKTIGSLANNTIHKRITRLYSFFRDLEMKEIYTFKKEVYKLKIEKYSNEIIALTNDEIKQLINLSIDKPHWQTIIDIFVCNCYMGLRFSDLQTITKYDFYIDNDGDYFLKKENKKTNITVEIPIQPISLSILQKYDFNLPRLTNQYFNRELKDILIHYDLFKDSVVKVRRVLSETKNTRLMKRDLISSHTCRRTFITQCINLNVPLNTLMMASGHTQLATLKSYVKKVQNKNAFKGLENV